MASMSLQAAFDQARQWLESNDLDRAIGLSEHILHAFPQNLEAYRILGEVCLANRQLDRAQESFERVLRSDPESIPAHVGLAITFERRGKLDRAVQEFEQALEIKPDMPELRSQLLRLYTEGGIENAQLRLSRAGLARLYAKGHMLAPAISEFRQVIKDQPERYDAKVALAETLWRNEQEADAATLCRKLLAERSDLLKARLILGYIELAEGRPEGEQQWRTAAAMDPYLTVARAMFDPMPPIAIEQPMIEEWDEQAWRKRLAEEQEHLAATRPMEVMAPVGGTADEEEFVPNASFFEHRTTPTPFDSAGSDDFLAGLLALGPSSPLPAAQPAQPTRSSEPDEGLDLDPDMRPFSLADLGLSDDELDSLDSLNTPPASASTSRTTPATPPAQAANTGLDDEDDDLQPFSFGLDASPPARSTPPAQTPAQAPAPVEEDDDFDLGMQPFSLDREQPPATPPSRSVSPQPPAPAQQEDDDDDLGLPMQPFSLADLGLSDEEIEGLESLQTGPASRPAPTGPAFTPPANMDLDDDDGLGDLPLDLRPFSMDELDQGSSRVSRHDAPGLPSSLEAFSLEEQPSQPRPRVSGLSSEAGLESGAEDEEELLPGQRGYSWQQPSQRPEPGFISSMRADQAEEEGSIFGKLKQRRQSEPPAEPEPIPPMSIAADEHLGLFSLDDVPLREESPGSGSIPQIAGIAQREGTSSGLPVEPPLPTAPAQSQERPAATSPAPAPETIDDLQSAIASGQVQPFSFADLGLTPEELAQLNVGDSAFEMPAEEATTEQDDDGLGGAFSFDLPAEEEPEQPGAFSFTEEVEAPAPFSMAQAEPPVETEDLQGAIAAGDLEPFSLADLGLSDEEIAALGLAEPSALVPGAAPSAEAPAAQEPEQTAPAVSEPLQITPSEDETQPFSFADLGISDDDLSGLDFGEPAQPVAPAETVPTQSSAAVPAPSEDEDAELNDLQSALSSGQVQPFSFADLGLSDEEIAALGLGETAQAAQEPEESEEPEAEPVQFELPQPPAVDDDQGFSFDLGLDEPEPPQAVTPPSQPATPQADEAGLQIEDLQPFSLADLGLSDEEIGSLNLEEPLAIESDEDDRLGLTEEELAGLDIGGDVDLHEVAAPTTPPPSQPGFSPLVTSGDLVADRLIALGREQGFVDISDIIAAVEDPEAESARIEEIGRLLHESNIEIRDGDEVIDMDAEYEEEEELEALPTFEPQLQSRPEEPDLTPFSLSDLGLSDDEIALLGLSEENSEPAPQPSTPQPADSDLTPFSLSELGLSDDDIASLDLGEASTPPSPAQPEPDLTPFSLSELGLSEEEIAALEAPEVAEPGTTQPAQAIPEEEPLFGGFSLDDIDLGESFDSVADESPTQSVEPVQQPVQPDEPDLTPFSLSELGLSDDEISALGGSETPEAPSTPVVPPAPVEIPAPPVAPVVTPIPTPVEQRPATPAPVRTQPPVTTGNDVLDGYLKRVEQEPQNYPLRLSVARASVRFERIDVGVRQYKQLVKQGVLLEDILDDMTDLIADTDDDHLLRQLHRVLGDTLSKQGRLQEAMDVYSWVPGAPKFAG